MSTPVAIPTNVNAKQRALLVAGAAIFALFIAGWVGWIAHAATHPTQKVNLVRTFDGRISYLGNAGSSGCVQPDSGGKQVCAGFLNDVAFPLHRGQHVHGAKAWITVPGDTYDAVIIYPTDPDAGGLR